MPNKEIPKEDRNLSEEEKVLVKRLTSKELEYIDKTLLSNANNNWQKIAMLVAIVMKELKDKIKGLPDVFYSKRVRKLVEDGYLESRGNLKYMRFSEVRLPNNKEDK